MIEIKLLVGSYVKHEHLLRCLMLFGLANSLNHFHSGYYNKGKYNYLKISKNLLDINVIYRFV